MKSKTLLACLLIFLIFNGTLMANEEDAQALLSRVAYQDLEGLKELIASGVDVNVQNDMQGMTALIMACTYGFTDIAKYLISEGADVNIQDTMYGYTALFGAAYSSQELVEILLANGADIHTKSKEGTTAFTVSVMGVLGESVTTDVASLLLERGADVDEASDTGPAAGYTCLMMVARNANPELVKFLLSKGADINAKAKDGSTALSLAMKENDTEMVALLKANGATE
jgi:ankyrin repeat protein